MEHAEVICDFPEWIVKGIAASILVSWILALGEASSPVMWTLKQPVERPRGEELSPATKIH